MDSRRRGWESGGESLALAEAAVSVVGGGKGDVDASVAKQLCQVQHRSDVAL